MILNGNNVHKHLTLMGKIKKIVPFTEILHTYSTVNPNKFVSLGTLHILLYINLRIENTFNMYCKVIIVKSSDAKVTQRLCYQ